jgi:electron transport complex protein RnfB
MSIAVLTIAIIALIAGIALSFASRRLPSDSGDLVEQVNDLLPQTQCGQCGYPGCRPYAAAIVDGSATINLCPPGGERLPGGCHCRRAAFYAHDYRKRMHRL